MKEDVPKPGNPSAAAAQGDVCAPDAKQMRDHKQAANFFTLFIKVAFVLLQVDPQGAEKTLPAQGPHSRRHWCGVAVTGTAKQGHLRAACGLRCQSVL